MPRDIYTHERRRNTLGNFQRVQLATMSSLVVMLPRGHRVKVSTNPNMSLLAIKVVMANFIFNCLMKNFRIQLISCNCLIQKSGYSLSFQLSDTKLQDTACTKKGLDPQMFTLEHKGKRVDLSSTVSELAISCCPLFCYFAKEDRLQNTSF